MKLPKPENKVRDKVGSAVAPTTASRREMLQHCSTGLG